MPVPNTLTGPNLTLKSIGDDKFSFKEKLYGFQNLMYLLKQTEQGREEIISFLNTQSKLGFHRILSSWRNGGVI